MSAELLARIDAFDIDGGPAALPFAARLAREHGWTRRFADRVVTEYKRFAYLAATAGQPVCPSQVVDHCWHLHLTYTRSYWTRFCREVLPAPLHHAPTTGGPSEQAKHRAMYDRTLAAYRAAFGHAPPADIWPPAGVRFGDDLREVTVNTAANWVVPKAVVRRSLAAASVAGLAVAGGVGADGGLNPFELVGVAFLSFLIPAMAAALAVGLLLRSLAKGGNSAADPALDWPHAALLAGGPQRLMAATITRLVERGVVRVDPVGGSLQATGPTPPDLTPVERVVWDTLPIIRPDAPRMLKLAKEVGAASTDLRQTLDDDGLTLTDAASKRAGWLTAAPLLLVLVGFGLPRLIAGMANGRPVGYLVAVVFVGGVVALMLRASRPYRTRAGDRVVADLSGRMKVTNYDSPNRALAVAALGTAALAGTELMALHGWYPKRLPASGDGSGSGGCGSDGGGGGGCGGGCGGCGGGD